ncbi:uncharacterized protein LOC110701804 [Chenopodium quinoa]|uniref:uncharacterized protein LOC110701804 n=1 Tax=Chenopodium quinoa TaxID=63459 RepID=UPI000B77FBB6|nr:uncharacterized protein LOC110701804 [Chenopodium quinoa]
MVFLWVGGFLGWVLADADQVIVDLQNSCCTCYHWQLTGLPCVHGFACILDKRTDPEQYVDHYYTRERYIEAYDLSIQPMPGPREKINMREPLPPPVRVMPGRPKSKKRKMERGEGAAEGSTQKKQKICQKCA